MNNKIERVAAEEGYALAHGQESFGDHLFGLLIFVKMSNRALDRDRDWLTFNKAADAIKDGLDTVSAALDPKGAEMREARMKEIKAIYENAGIPAIYMEPLPNGYCSKPCCLNKPWAQVTSSIGRVVIRRRKSVISIDWKDSRVKRTGNELFPNENVTRWDTGIHAWGPAKATEYIRRLHNSDAIQAVP